MSHQFGNFLGRCQLKSLRIIAYFLFFSNFYTMKAFPVLQTKRLWLRERLDSDIEAIVELAGDRAIYEGTCLVPHPYERHMAVEFTQKCRQAFKEGTAIAWSIALDQTSPLIGVMALRLDKAHDSADLGYWVGKPYWGNGYCTEALLAVIEYGFNSLNLNRIEGRHFADNPASARVMEKAGMPLDGVLREQFKKDGIYKSMAVRSILRGDYFAQS